MLSEVPSDLLQQNNQFEEGSNSALVEYEQYPYQNHRRRRRNDCNHTNNDDDSCRNNNSVVTPKIRTNSNRTNAMIIRKSSSYCYNAWFNVAVVVTILLISIVEIVPTFANGVENQGSSIRIRIGSQQVQQQEDLPMNSKNSNYNLDKFHQHNIHQRLLNGYQQRISKGMTMSSLERTASNRQNNERQLIGQQQQEGGKHPNDVSTTTSKTTNTKGTNNNKDKSSETAPVSSPLVVSTDVVKNRQKGIRGGGSSTTAQVKGAATDNTKTKGGGTTKQQQDSGTAIPLATFTIELETRGGSTVDTANDEKDGKKKDNKNHDFEKEKMDEIELIVANYLHTAMKLLTNDVVTIQGTVLDPSNKDEAKKGKGKDDTITTPATTTTSSRIFQFDGTVSSNDSQNIPPSIQKSILWRRQNTALTDAYHELEVALVGFLQGTNSTTSSSSTTTNTTTTAGEDSAGVGSNSNSTTKTNNTSSSTIRIVDVDMSKLGGTSPQYYAEDDEDDDNTGSDSSSSSGTTGSSPSNPKNSLQLENIHSPNRAETQGTFVVVLVVANILFAMIIGCFWRFTKQKKSSEKSGQNNDNDNTDEEDILITTKPEPVVPSQDDIRTFYLKTMFRKQKSSAVSHDKIPKTISTKNKGSKKTKKRNTVHPLPTISTGSPTQQLQQQQQPGEGDITVVPIASNSNDQVQFLGEDTTESSSSTSSTRSTDSSGDGNNNIGSVDPVVASPAPFRVPTVTASVGDNTDNNDTDRSQPIIFQSSSSSMSFREQMALSLSMLTPSDEEDDEDIEDNLNNCHNTNDDHQNLYDDLDYENEPCITTAIFTSMQENEQYIPNRDHDDSVVIRFHEDGINYNSQEAYSWTKQGGSADDSAETTVSSTVKLV